MHKDSNESPSKDPLMSPTRGVWRDKKAVPNSGHARINVSYKCISPDSSPGNSPIYSINKPFTNQIKTKQIPNNTESAYFSNDDCLSVSDKLLPRSLNGRSCCTDTT